MSDLLVLLPPSAPRPSGECIAHRSPAGTGVSLIEQLLAEQQELTAVEVFARDQESGEIPDQSRRYHRLLPATAPSPGQQYGFEVDLDRCSGCKACVTACHSLNGLDASETWRDVGLLIGGTESSPVMQHVTAACHHCLEPACMSACPVDAYEKDPVTGIVRHLDDQCFGCQYCTLACPYNVPKYHSGKGIVRKCDMCSNRLAHGEAPACVQACPHEAIAIRIVDVAQVVENAEADPFLPGAPEPHLTLPTTAYRTARVFPRNLLPADYYSISPQHPHWPLVLMLVLTQLSVGAFVTGCLMDLFADRPWSARCRPVHATGALVFGLLALAASTLHLGRPQFAFRGLIGLRHSWLSREILAFGAFAALAVPYAGACWLTSVPGAAETPWGQVTESITPALGVLVAVTGVLGVACSVMIYAFTRRELWSSGRTSLRFGLTSAILGIATIWALITCVNSSSDFPVPSADAGSFVDLLVKCLIVASTVKLTCDASVLMHLSSVRTTPLKRTAMLVCGPLSRYSWIRLLTGLAGGVLIPLWVCRAGVLSGMSFRDAGPAAAAVLAWLLCLVGETCERYLFFAAVATHRMPGGVRS